MKPTLLSTTRAAVVNVLIKFGAAVACYSAICSARSEVKWGCQQVVVCLNVCFAVEVLPFVL